MRGGKTRREVLAELAERQDAARARLVELLRLHPLGGVDVRAMARFWDDPPLFWPADWSPKKDRSRTVTGRIEESPAERRRRERSEERLTAVMHRLRVRYGLAPAVPTRRVSAEEMAAIRRELAAGVSP
jgi:hypothetical protein